MLFRYIAIKKNKVNLAYDNVNSMGTHDSISMKCDEEPAPSFRAALDNLAPVMSELCELSKQDAERITMQGVSISYHGDHNRMGIILSGFKKLLHSTGVMVINSPLRLEREDKENPKRDISEELREMVDKLQDEAIKYLNGHRQQTTMKMDERPPKQDKKPEKKPAKEKGAKK